MIIDSQISEKKLNQLIRLARVSKRSGLAYFIVFASITIAGICSYLMFLNAGVFPVFNFSFLFIVITCFLLTFLSLGWKAQLWPGLCVLKQIMGSISNGDWSCNVSYFKNLPPAMLRHPVTRNIIGLYLCKYGKTTEGLQIISGAASELPAINKSTSEGKVSDINEFKKLHDVITHDVYPSTFMKIFDSVSDIFGSVALAYACFVIVLILFKFLICK